MYPVNRKLNSLFPDPLVELDNNSNSWFETPIDTLQLQKDVLDVYEGRVDITTFPEEYQERIKNYYRFAPRLFDTKYAVDSKAPKVAKNTKDLL
jgi:hypothetical protein